MFHYKKKKNWKKISDVYFTSAEKEDGRFEILLTEKYNRKGQRLWLLSDNHQECILYGASMKKCRKIAQKQAVRYPCG